MAQQGAKNILSSYTLLHAYFYGPYGTYSATKSFNAPGALEVGLWAKVSLVGALEQQNMLVGPL